MSLLSLIKKGEGKTLEFKEKLPGGESIARTVVAFSNSGGGKLLIGVSNDRQVVGLDESELFSVQEKIASIVYDSCYPNIVPEIYAANLDGKLIIVIEVFRGSLLPYYLKKDGKLNGTYIRVASSNRKASLENIVELERQRSNKSFDEEPCYDHKFADLDLTGLKTRFAASGKELSMEHLLNLKLALKEKNKILPTNGLLILLGLFDHVAIKCSRFKGKTMGVFLDKKEYVGDIFQQLESAVAFILNHIKIRGEINGLQRSDIPEIPIEAIREAMINALVHRDYANSGRDIKLGIYDDLLNIVSPGGLPSSLSEDDILDGRSEIRNKVIAKVFKELNYIEQWGSGIRRIISSCIDNGLRQPSFREKGDFFDVEIFRASPLTAGLDDKSAGLDDKSAGLDDKSAGLDDKSAGLAKTLSTDMTTQEKRVMQLAADQQRITSGDVATLLSVKERRARVILQHLLAKNLLKKAGGARNTSYALPALL